MVVGKGVREVRGVKMRSLRKNSRKLYYSAYEDEQPIYATDKKGDIVYDDVDGDLIPRIIDYQSGYGEPKEFFGNIAFAGGESEAEVYGVSIDSYDAKLLMPHGALPITETSIIFQNSTPEYGRNGMVVENSADYRVVKISDSLNEVVYLLKRIIHND